jgi:Zn-dependent protease with chaperone function
MAPKLTKKFPIINNAFDYEYLPDTQARKELDKFVELKAITKKFLSEVAEPWLNSELSGTSVKVSKNQFPEIYYLAEEIANSLGIYTPQIFIQQNPYVNSFTHGTGNQNFIVLTNKLLEELQEDYLAFILGHEMGHIKSQHVLYKTLFSWLLRYYSNADKYPEDLMLSFLDWERKSEITADRVGLLICQDMEIACRSLLTLAIGSLSLSLKINIDDYIETQLLSLEYNPLSERNQFYQSHPYIPVRMKELINFFNLPQYKNIVLEDSLEIELK